MKKGYFFTLDAFLAVGIIIMGMIVIYAVYSYSPATTQIRTYAQDTLTLFTTAKLQDLNSNQINQLYEWGVIQNRRNTLLEQIGEFYFRASITHNNTYMLLLSAMLSEITKNLVQQEYGIEFLVDGVSVYQREPEMGSSTSQVLLTSKTPIVGIYNSTALWGPYLIEVRIWQ
jgi:hypothetical protein